VKPRGRRGKNSGAKRQNAETLLHQTRPGNKALANSRVGDQSADLESAAQVHATPKVASRTTAMAEIGAAEALSFLKETKGEVSWTAKEMAQTLRISAKEAEQALALLQMQGYVKASGKEWLTTPAGEAVTGAKPPRFARESVEQALAALKQRISEFNRDSTEEFKVTEAVAFGDVLSGRAQVQAADVGVQLTRRKSERRTQDVDTTTSSAVEQAAQSATLRKLRGRTALLHLRPYEPWMSHRLHRKIL